MVIITMASVPLSTGFQFIPSHLLMPRATIPYDGCKRKSQRIPEMAGATAYGQMSNVRTIAVARRARLAMVAINSPTVIDTVATARLKVNVVRIDLR